MPPKTGLRLESRTSSGIPEPSTITSPLPLTVYDTVTTITVAGTAKPALDGDPLDSVVVYAGDEQLLLSGLEEWAASWTTPAVTETTHLTIVATANAGAEAHSDSVQIILLAPDEEVPPR